MPTIFISYSHDSNEHRERVLALSERLRKDGLETLLDQYVNGSPPQGWPRWMLDQLDAADSVLVVCTKTYYRRFRGHEKPGKGKGADWEGALVTQEIYDSRSRTLKFVPVFLSAPVDDWIPEPLRAATHYVLTSEAGYQLLYDFLTGQAGVQPGPVGVLKTRSRRKGSALTFEELPASGSANAQPTPQKVGPGKLKKNVSRQDEARDKAILRAASKGESSNPAGTETEWYNRGLRFLSAGNYDEAMDALNHAIQLNPAMPLAYYNRGLTYSYQDNSDLAIEDFNRALELGFDHALLFRNRGNAFSRKGDVKGALADYERAISLEPDNPLVYLNRGQVYENILRKDLAKADYQKILTLVCEPQLQEEACKRLQAMGIAVSVSPSSLPTSPALTLWRKKLSFLQTEEAKAADPEQKFSLQERIEEARTKIRELGG